MTSNIGWRGVASHTASYPHEHDTDPRRHTRRHRRFGAAETRDLAADAVAERAAEHDEDDEPEDAGYLAWLAEGDAQEQRRRARHGQKPPMTWGTRLDAEHYFCTACWAAGFEPAAHPDTMPPCDPPGTVRGPFDPR
jgi:hypothetical protein